MGNVAVNLGEPYFHPKKGVSDEKSNMSKMAKCLADSNKHTYVRDKKSTRSEYPLKGDKGCSQVGERGKHLVGDQESCQ